LTASDPMSSPILEQDGRPSEKIAIGFVSFHCN